MTKIYEVGFPLKRRERERGRDGDKEVFEKTIPKYFPKLIDTKVQIQIAQDTSSKKNKMHAWIYQRYIAKKKSQGKILQVNEDENILQIREHR